MVIIGVVTVVRLLPIVATVHNCKKIRSNQINMIYLIVSFVCMFSCVGGTSSTISNETSGSDFFVFDLENSISQRIGAVPLNSLIDSVLFIPLETTKDALFRYRSLNFGIISQNMFISGSGSAVLQFDFKGKYIGQIVREGRGPYELPSIFAWYTHSALQQLNAVGSGGKMVIKSFKSGKITDVRSDSRSSFEKVPLNDGSFVATAPYLGIELKDFPYLYFFDENGKEIATKKYSNERDIFIIVREGEGSWPNETHNVLPSFTGNALFKDAYNDTIYLIRSAEDIIPYLVFKSGKYMPLVKDAQNFENKSKQIFIRNIIETEDYILLYTVYNKNLYYDIWSKKNLQLFSRAKVDINSHHRIVGGHWTNYEFPNGEIHLINISVIFLSCKKNVNLIALLACFARQERILTAIR